MNHSIIKNINDIYIQYNAKIKLGIYRKKEEKTTTIIITTTIYYYNKTKKMQK